MVEGVATQSPINVDMEIAGKTVTLELDTGASVWGKIACCGSNFCPSQVLTAGAFDPDINRYQRRWSNIIGKRLAAVVLA